VRQKKVISILYDKFNKANYREKSKILTSIIKLFSYNSDVPAGLALELLPTLRKDTKLQFGTLPGYYKTEGEDVFYFPYEIETQQNNESLKVFDSSKRKPI
jgi:hypothetical protein